MPKYEGKNRFSKQHNLNILSVDNFINQKVQILDSLFKKNHVMIEKFHNRITYFYSIIYVQACTVFHKWKYIEKTIILLNPKAKQCVTSFKLNFPKLFEHFSVFSLTCRIFSVCGSGLIFIAIYCNINCNKLRNL